MSWLEAVEAVTPYVAKIQTPDGYGTGVMFAYNKNKTLVAIGTAAHVVEHADEWKQPIRIATEASLSSPLYLGESERVIFVDRARDSATIVFKPDEMTFPEEPLPMMEDNRFKAMGTAVGWLGYPALYPSQLCFFRGYVSSFLQGDDCYLVDGVAINGVSGGPLFDEATKPKLIGVVSAYHPNRQRDVVLPGLLRAQDFTHMHAAIKTMKNVDEARERKEAETAKTITSSAESPVVPDRTPSRPDATDA